MRNFIIGTDWSSDCDDVVAMRVFCMAHKAGKINILGICLDDNTELSVPSLYGFLNTERCKFPIGFDFSAKPGKSEMTYQYALSSLTAHKTGDATDGVAFYRKLLAESSEPVDIAEIGFQTVLAKLLKSKPDKYSPLCGRELVAQKVQKLWLMAGKWDEQKSLEHNICATKAARKAAAYVSKNWPTPITYLGWEVANTIITADNLPFFDFVGRAIMDYGRDAGTGRESWDPMLALLACIGDEAKAGFSAVKGKAVISSHSGKCSFVRGRGNHQYIIKTNPDEFYSSWINSILLGNYFEKAE